MCKAEVLLLVMGSSIIMDLHSRKKLVVYINCAHRWCISCPQIRQKETAKAETSITRDPVKEKKLEMLARLPDFCRILRMYPPLSMKDCSPCVVTTCIYVIGFEKRAHFVQSYNFRYGFKQSRMHLYKQHKSQISNVHISALEAATDTKQSVIGSSGAVL